MEDHQHSNKQPKQNSGSTYKKKRSDGSSEYLFEDKEILSEMEKYHIEKNDGSFIDDMGARQVVQELRDSEKVKLQTGTILSIMNVDISEQEVELTFGTSSGTPGYDGIHAKLIDKEDRSTMMECLFLLYNKAWLEGSFPKQ